MKKTGNVVVLILSFLVVFIFAFAGSVFTSGNTRSAWYLENRPSFTPPNLVFPIVWNILYALIAFSLYFAWIAANQKQKIKIAFAFGINLLANALWSYFFFALKNPLLALMDLIFILATIIWMIVVVYRINKNSGWLLVPYLLWVCFAGFLNAAFIS